MAEPITPKRSPFFAGPQAGRPQPKPVVKPVTRPGVRPIPQKAVPSAASQNKKVMLIVGIVVVAVLLIAGIAGYFLWQSFTTELITKL
ncbi:hypothetical protein CL616_03330 [archaeon]|nr:hypothetical protein [archaeon]|tara:strand:- start:771 stop:1034 length:264 start_codon:yes stop_codon:yes gene_type:complete